MSAVLEKLPVILAERSEDVAWTNPFLSDMDPSDEIADRLAPDGGEGRTPLPTTYEATVDCLLDADCNASGFMRGPVRAVFVKYPADQWEKAHAACPALILDEFRAIRFYTENYFREINRGLRYMRYPFAPFAPDGGTDTAQRAEGEPETESAWKDEVWRFTRLYWWMHSGIRKLARVQSRMERVFRWQKPDRWQHWTVGSIYTSRSFTSTAVGPNPPVEQKYRYGDHFGSLLLIFDLRNMPRECIADISMCSKFALEGEALLLPWLRFRVTDVRRLSVDEQKEWQSTDSIALQYCGHLSQI